MGITCVHSLEAEQEEIRPRIQRHMQCRTTFLRVPHTQHKQIFILEVVAHDGVAIREHFAVVREDESPRRQSTTRCRDDAVAERRHEQVQRQLGYRHDRTI